MTAPAAVSESLAVNTARIVPDRSGAALVEPCGTLLVADLHFEKGSGLAARGSLLPPYDTRATLARLADAIARLKPARVVALGDSFHDLGADGRIHEDDARTLADLVASVADWVWIEGNHDPAPPPRFGGRIVAELETGPLVLRHEPRPGPQAGEIAGHLHPCAKVRGRGRAVRRRCFVTDGDRLILPAFGAFAGGLNIRDAAYDGLFARAPEAWMIGADRVYRVPARRCVGD
ncbi:ligase-associated DNA damage response endonuclease PdeM [Marinicauda salina]|uniref:Ligase-associated DNA damage response endonuclease PdeM n=1 Tax=Marinicauda salina TaxID=2135793 RepID=A0A2U2BXZ1_9PROT|nr:ligase-associated DNA damage response endonuclease PdeM [Marinicauda salina]PWE18881.1 ligase-associated DNA damage response endonuclease PdeM [Marinicauda salina]